VDPAPFICSRIQVSACAVVRIVRHGVKGEIISQNKLRKDCGSCWNLKGETWSRNKTELAHQQTAKALEARGIFGGRIS
jgi:hypothetical protein